MSLMIGLIIRLIVLLFGEFPVILHQHSAFARGMVTRIRMIQVITE